MTGVLRPEDILFGVVAAEFGSGRSCGGGGREERRREEVPELGGMGKSGGVDADGGGGMASFAPANVGDFLRGAIKAALISNSCEGLLCANPILIGDGRGLPKRD